MTGRQRWRSDGSKSNYSITPINEENYFQQIQSTTNQEVENNVNFFGEALFVKEAKHEKCFTEFLFLKSKLVLANTISHGRNLYVKFNKKNRLDKE